MHKPDSNVRAEKHFPPEPGCRMCKYTLDVACVYDCNALYARIDELTQIDKESRIHELTKIDKESRIHEPRGLGEV